MSIFFDHTDDISLSSSDDMDINLQNTFDSDFHNDIISFPNEFNFQHDNQVDSTSFMNVDYNQFPKLCGHNRDFTGHEITDHINGFSHENDINDFSNIHHNEMHFGQTSFSGIYTDAEIEKMKDNVEHYQYVVDTLNSKVHHLEIVVDLAKNNKESINTDCKVDQLNDAISEYNNALSDLKDAQIKLNNAT